MNRIDIPIMHPEQNLMTNETCVLDISKAKRDLGWELRDSDVAMLFAEYRGDRKSL